jgi:hypothetical protein
MIVMILMKLLRNVRAAKRGSFPQLPPTPLLLNSLDLLDFPSHPTV